MMSKDPHLLPAVAFAATVFVAVGIGLYGCLEYLRKESERGLAD